MEMLSDNSKAVSEFQQGDPERSQNYDPQFFAKIVKVEDRHFWYQARNAVITTIVKGVVRDLSSQFRVMEVGCGTGVVLRELARMCGREHVIGLELFPEAVAFARARTGCHVFVADILSPPSELGQFDVVCIFDVLEHLPDQQRTMRALAKVLKPNGMVIVTVPAHASLWSYFDVAGRHCRRYEGASLSGVLEDAGFTVRYMSEFMMALYPLMWLLRRINGRKALTPEQAAAKASSELKVVPIVNSVLKLLLAWEPLALKLGMTIPIGTSLLAVAEKRERDDRHR